MMAYPEVLVANFESGTSIIYDNQLLNVENLAVENDTTSSETSFHVSQSIWTLRWRGTHGWTSTKQLWRSLSRQPLSIT